jgi:hypothetical protein
MTIVALVLLTIGVVAPLWFVMDYLRTANFKQPFAIQVIALNVSLAGVFFVNLMQILGLMIFTEFFWIWLQFAFFAVVNIALISQIFLLRKARKSGKKIVVELLDEEVVRDTEKI